MISKLTFRRRYFVAVLLLFAIEVLIAVYAKDRFIRPLLGDFLVVILMYCFVRSFIKIGRFKAAFWVLMISFLVEFLQYLNVLEVLGLSHSPIARLLLGTTFSWNDLLAYSLGLLATLLAEYLFSRRRDQLQAR